MTYFANGPLGQLIRRKYISCWTIWWKIISHHHLLQRAPHSPEKVKYANVALPLQKFNYHVMFCACGNVLSKKCKSCNRYLLVTASLRTVVASKRVASTTLNKIKQLVENKYFSVAIRRRLEEYEQYDRGSSSRTGNRAFVQFQKVYTSASRHKRNGSPTLV